MNIFLLLLLVFLSGMGLSAQASVNGALGKTVGPLSAALFSIATSLVLLSGIGILTHNLKFENLLSVPKWQYLGGLFGGLYIVVIAFSVSKINVQLAVAVAVLGQMLMSAIIDHFGLFGLQQNPINLLRFVGLCFLVAGLVFIYQGSMKPN